MELQLRENITRSEYLTIEGYHTLKNIMFNYLVNDAGKDEVMADTYTSYSYKTFNSIKFVSLILVEIDNQPYFVEEIFYGEDGKSIFGKGEYAGKKYNFELR